MFEKSYYWDPIFFFFFVKLRLTNDTVPALYNESFDQQTHPCPKLYKIFQYLNYKNQSLYDMERDVAIDESLLYKGRLGWKQYIPIKRAQFEIKSYMLCESSSGYIWSLIIYTGNGIKFDKEYERLGVSTRIIMTLLKRLLMKRHWLQITFTHQLNLQIYFWLHELTHMALLDVTGETFHQNWKRSWKRMRFQKGKNMVIKWKDKTDVTILSTVHNAEMIIKEQRGEICRRQLRITITQWVE